MVSKYPWQVVGTDFFELDRKQYLVVVDYFSRYPEIVKMNSITSACTIAALKTFLPGMAYLKLLGVKMDLNTAPTNLLLLQGPTNFIMQQVAPISAE